MRKIVLLLMLILTLSLAACGGEDVPAAGGGGQGDAAAGERVYNQEAAPACGSCHSLEPGKAVLGPSLAKIGADAGSRASGQSAEEYLRESITNPNAFVVDGFGANIMTATYGSQLTEKQIDDLVAYLMTLK
jgi:mono/diheme cytochrome c family protein